MGKASPGIGVRCACGHSGLHQVSWECQLTGFDQWGGPRGSESMGYTGFPGTWVFQWTETWGLILNVSSALGIMTAKCFVQVRPAFHSIFSPLMLPGSSGPLIKKSQLGRLSSPSLLASSSVQNRQGAAHPFFTPATETQQVPAERAEDLKSSNLGSFP